MTSTPDAEPTRDAFLGGRLHLFQPRKGYRAGVDPVLLAASVSATRGQSVLELGCGVGAALFALATRVPGLDLTGIELQPDYADLARRNADANGLPATIFTADLTELPDPIRQRRFDHVIANPPYYAPGTGTEPQRPDRATAHRETLTLRNWVAVGGRRLVPGGTLSVIQRADRLADLLGAVNGTLGSILVRPLQPRAGRDASLVIVQARKGGRAPLRIAEPVLIHGAARHEGDGEDYSETVREVLRNAAPLPGN